MSTDNFLSFPASFVWGAATASYQIEGAWNEGGRGVSIWDTFTSLPGKVYQGDTGEVAADHYHRWQEDVQIMADLGLKAYRFSISWPRILPQGSGEANPEGLDFYDRLVDALLEQGIRPYVTLYHWDLPQALQDRGGWANRDIVYKFADYASILAARLGDRVEYWITHNEPFVTALAGHFTGEHAPGLQDISMALQVAHHLLLSHGLAVDALRHTIKRPIQAGITLNLTSVHAASESEADQQAAWRYDGINNRFFLDPLFRSEYPADMLQTFGPFFPAPPADDLKQIAVPIDFLGVNYYDRMVARYDPDFPFLQASQVRPLGNEYSQMWEIYPPGIHELLVRIWKDYHPASLYVTENGIPVADAPDFDGRVRDYRRIRYLRDHIIQLHRAIQEGVPLNGYFVWSLMDNFEWAYGYRMRFGMVYIDYTSLSRTVKESGHWYSQVMRDNGLDPSAGDPYFPR